MENLKPEDIPGVMLIEPEQVFPRPEELVREVKAGDSYLHVNVRERASEERVAAASAAVAERVMAWLRERTVAAATKVSP